MIERDKVCQECGELRDKMDIHHKEYPEVFGTEDLDDLVLLCSECHAKLHKNLNVKA